MHGHGRMAWKESIIGGHCFRSSPFAFVFLVLLSSDHLDDHLYISLWHPFWPWTDPTERNDSSFFLFILHLFSYFLRLCFLASLLSYPGTCACLKSPLVIYFLSPIIPLFSLACIAGNMVVLSIAMENVQNNSHDVNPVLVYCSQF